ncbi:MAG: DUF805 domain-containing protein [Selenomonadaceae bacterium]|nr:DUF805 domain-containing protein [Selenomonadaceae bacterium]
MELLEQVFTTEGRLNRLRYLKYQLIWSLLVGLAGGILTVLGELVTNDPQSVLVTIPTGIMSFVGFVGGFRLAIRRLHDLDKSGWFMLLWIVPVVNVIFAIYLFCFKGTDGYNRYGADPLMY